jgi:hypothetical protein
MRITQGGSALVVRGHFITAGQIMPVIQICCFFLQVIFSLRLAISVLKSHGV